MGWNKNNCVSNQRLQSEGIEDEAAEGLGPYLEYVKMAVEFQIYLQKNKKPLNAFKSREVI